MNFDDLVFDVGDRPAPAEVTEATLTPPKQERATPTSVDHRQVGPPPIYHYTLDCKAFDSEKSVRFTNRCCEGHSCHDAGHRIVVRPPRGNPETHGYTRDSELGIDAAVCCGRYSFVMSLSREWWVRKMLELDGVTDVNKVNERLYEALSWHPAYEERRNNRGTTKVGKKEVKATCLFCGKATSNVEGICDKCMP